MQGAGMIKGNLNKKYAVGASDPEELRIIILEDDPRDVDRIKRSLQRDGIRFKAHSLNTFEGFLEALDMFQPDIVLSDCHLHKFDEMDVVHLLSARAPGIPLIVITGLNNEETVVNSIKSGATNFVAKQNLNRLGSAIRAALKDGPVAQADERNEAAIRRAAREWRATFDAISQCICLLDSDGKIQRGNRAFRNLVGKNWSEIIGQTCHQLMHRSDDFIEGCPLEMAKRHGAYIPLELPIGDRVFKVRVEPVHEMDQQKAGWVHFMTDITELKQIQNRETLARKVLELLNRQVSLEESVAAILGFIKTDMNIEAAAIRLREGEDFPYFLSSGFSEDFLCAESYLCKRDDAGEILRDMDGHVIPACMCGNILLQRTNASLPFFTENGSYWTNCAAQLQASNTEGRWGSLAKNRCSQNGYESVALIPIRSADSIIGLLQLNDRRPDRFSLEFVHFLEALGESIGIALARKQAVAGLMESEASLRESEEWHRTILYAAMDGFCVADTQGRLMEVNDAYCRMSGYSKQELLSMRVSNSENNETADLISINFKELMAKGDGRFESQHRHKDGSIFDVEVSVQYKNVKGGRLVIFLHDITARKRAAKEKAVLEMQLRQAQKMELIGQLAGGLAHDFNNMLTVILGFDEMALKLINPSSPIHTAMVEIRNAGQRGADLARQLLAFARRQIVVPIVLNLNESVSGMLAMLGRLIGEGIRLQWKPADDLWPVKLDKSQIDQMMANLCVNARDAITGVGEITIETANVVIGKNYQMAYDADFEPGEYVRLSVSDNGCGMDSKTLARIFEPFFTTKQEGKGTGLGLAMVYGSIKQSQGFIQVNSSPGKGTTFVLHFPRYAGEVESEEKKFVDQANRTGSETILLVDDEPSILQLVKMLLKEQGYNVLVASLPGEAIRLAQNYEGDIHLLMTDVVMPDMNGRDLAINLLTIYPQLKCLFMSGYEENLFESPISAESNLVFIQKPFSPQELNAKLREALN
jgi:PAS domain S-box-containing protein